MVALRTVTKAQQAQETRDDNILSMIGRIVKRGTCYLVPSSSCGDLTPTKKTVKQWYTVNLKTKYCECKGGGPKNHCMHKLAVYALREQEREQRYQLYAAFELSLSNVNE